MSELGPGRKPMIMPHYPHMMAEDVAVWTTFLEQEPNYFDEVWYDVHVGQPASLPVGAPDYLTRVSDGVTRKRIDVVARSGERYFVIEIKPYGNMVALGQALAYHRLFCLEYPRCFPAIACVVCNAIDMDIKSTFQEQLVVVFETGSKV